MNSRLSVPVGLPVVLSDPPPFGLGHDWRAIIAEEPPIPGFLKRPAETRTLSEIAKAADDAARAFVRSTFQEPAPKAAFVDDAALRRQADAMWREWMPNRTETTRPQLRSILKRLRAQAEAKGKPMSSKPTTKADGLRVMREQNAQARERAAKTTRAPKPAPDDPVTPKAPATPEPVTPKESPVKKTKAKKTSKPKGGEPKKKVDLIRGLLTRAGGCTQKEILSVTGWPSVSVPQQAAALNLTLKTKKEGRATRYWAT